MLQLRLKEGAAEQVYFAPIILSEVKADVSEFTPEISVG